MGNKAWFLEKHELFGWILLLEIRVGSSQSVLFPVLNFYTSHLQSQGIENFDVNSRKRMTCKYGLQS